MIDRHIQICIGEEELETKISFQTRMDSHLYGARAIASENKEELSGLAKDVWKVDPKEHYIDFILVDNVNELLVKNTKVFYGVAKAYIGR